jgi:hypothetical protein
MTKNDPRAAFAGIETPELREELEEIAHRRQLVGQDLDRARPTGKQIEDSIDAARERAADFLGGPRGLEVVRSLTAVPGSQGFRVLTEAATLHVLASDDFAERMKRDVAARRPSETDLAPLREKLAEFDRHERAIRAELDLRKLMTSARSRTPGARLPSKHSEATSDGSQEWGAVRLLRFGWPRGLARSPLRRAVEGRTMIVRSRYGCAAPHDHRRRLCPGTTPRSSTATGGRRGADRG